jgi:hypothetical protein
MQFPASQWVIPDSLKADFLAKHDAISGGQETDS